MRNIKSGFTRTSLTKKININGVYTIHYFKYGRNFRFKGEKHDFWEMIYLDSGNATVIADDKKLYLKQGEAFFHRPNEMHNVYTDDEFANSAIISFECNSKDLDSIAGKVLLLNDYEKIILNKIIQEAKISFSDKLNDLHLNKMNKRPNAPFGGEQIIKNSIELLIISLIRNDKDNCKFSIDTTKLNAGSDSIVDNVCSIMQEKLDSSSGLNLDDVSFRLGFSKSYIKTLFKKKTGYSIIQYFIELKMEKAKKLLSQQRYTVSEIAYQLGFSSVYYFSRQFKMHTDMAPTEYITSIKADNVL